MSKKEQRRFVRDLIRNVRADLLMRTKLIPDEWDGHELRQWIADCFQAASFTLDTMPARRRAYRNEILTRGL